MNNQLVITAYLSERRLENLLEDYWQRFGSKLHQMDWSLTMMYFPSCPQVDAEGTTWERIDYRNLEVE